MRLLYQVSTTMIGGQERFLLRLAQGIHSLRPNWVLDCLVMGSHGALHEEYKATFKTLYATPLRKVDAADTLAHVADNGRYDICHCLDCFSVTKPAAELCPKVKFVQNVFPRAPDSPFAPQPEWLNDPDLPYAALVTETKANAEKLPELPRGTHHVIPNGIDTQFWRPKGRVKRDIDVVWVGHAGRNGYDMAMQLSPRLDGLRYLMVVSEIDALSPEKLRNVFQRSRLFLSTSKQEGMPATPLEAAACGCHPLVPNIDGLAEVFGGFSRFTYTPPKTAEELREAIVGLMPFLHSDSQGSAVARIIAERYDIRNTVAAYLKLYENVTA